MPIKTENTSDEITIKQYADKTESAQHRWWLVPDQDIYASVFSVCNEVLLNLNIRRRMNYFFSTLYNDIGAAFTSSQNVNLYYNRTALDGNAISNSRMTLNVLQNVIDTATAMVGKNKPKPQFVTDGAKDYNTKMKAKKATKYVEGVFDESNIYQIAQRVFQDACIYGTGFIKLVEDNNKIKAEWVYIEQILVDDLEGMDQMPRQIHQRKYVQRDVLIEQFADGDETIIQNIMDASQIAGGAATFSTADIIPVIESWHLPSGPKASDGKHSIVIENCTLFAEEYKKDYFPIFPFRWADQTLGFWGRGICHEIWKLQLELDTLLRLIQQSMRLVGGPVLAVESGSNIAEDHLTSNRIAKIIEYTAVEPKWLTPPTCQPEIFSHVQYLEDRMYKVTGVSQANATATKDPTLKSGVAQREAADQAASRLERVGQMYEKLFLDLAKAIIDMSADLKNPSVLVNDKGKGQRLDFKDIKMNVEDYQIQLFPVSGLSSTPAGRLDQLMDYAQAGYLSKEQVMDIVDFPDLNDTVSLETASLHLTQEILGNIKEKGKEAYISPGVYLDLATAFRMACLEVDRAQLQGVPEDHIELIRDWAMECKALIDQSQVQPAPAQQNAGTPSQQGSAQVGAQMQNAQPQASQPIPTQGQ